MSLSAATPIDITQMAQKMEAMLQEIQKNTKISQDLLLKIDNLERKIGENKAAIEEVKKQSQKNEREIKKEGEESRKEVRRSALANKEGQKALGKIREKSL